LNVVNSKYVFNTFIIIEIFSIVCQNEGEAIFYLNSFESAYID